MFFKQTSKVHRCCGWQPVCKEDRGMIKDNYWIIRKLAYLEEDVASCDRISTGRYFFPQVKYLIVPKWCHSYNRALHIDYHGYN